MCTLSIYTNYKNSLTFVRLYYSHSRILEANSTLILGVRI